MPTIKKQVRKWSVVVEATPNKEGLGIGLSYSAMEERLQELEKSFQVRYWAILHDCDTDEDGVLKREHWHLVLEFPTKKTDLGVVRNLAEILQVDKTRVSVQQCRSLNMDIRYLMHLDDPDKASYPPFSVLTNDKSILALALNSCGAELTIDELIEAIKNSDNLPLLIRKIGLKNYARYRNVIRDLMQELAR